jgi:hypothetical protein
MAVWVQIATSIAIVGTPEAPRKCPERSDKRDEDGAAKDIYHAFGSPLGVTLREPPEGLAVKLLPITVPKILPNAPRWPRVFGPANDRNRRRAVEGSQRAEWGVCAECRPSPVWPAGSASARLFS